MKKSKNLSTIIFKTIFKKEFQIGEIRSKEFLDMLYNHDFKEIEILDNALKGYQNAVFTSKAIHAILISIDGDPSISQLPTENKIREAMGLRHLVEEYNYDGPFCYPKWYLQARQKLEFRDKNSGTKTQNQEVL